MTTTSGNFFENALDSAVEWVEQEWDKVEGEVAPIEQSIAKFGDAVVNEIKTLEANPTIDLAAGWFVKIAEGIDPALTPLISGIELEFPKILNVATGVLGEVTKSVGEQVSDGLTALSNIKGINGTIYAGILTTINAAVQNYVVSNNATSVGVANPAQLITTAVAVHAQAS